jgi:hypothetical protein
MKSTLQTLLISLLLAAPIAGQAQVYAESGFAYTVNPDGYTITITGYSGSGGSVAFPANIEGNAVTVIGRGSEIFASDSGVTNVTIPGSVTSIGEGAFAGSDLVSVTIPGSVISIGSSAFSTCDSLTNVTISNGVMSIGEDAFYRSDLLTNVTIPSSVIDIGVDAFNSCFSLVAITVDAHNSSYSSVDGVLFDKSLTTLIEAPPGLGGSYTVPNSVTSIGEDAFSFCGLTNVTLLNGVTSIEDGGFSDCWLAGITIPGSVTKIGSYAFYNCNALTNVTIPGSVTNIGEYAFFACGILTGAYFGGNAPLADSTVFIGDGQPFTVPMKVYYLPGTTGWSSTFAGQPTALWQLPYPVILNNGPNFGVQSNMFGFTISWATNISLVVEASTNLAGSVWTAFQTNALTNGVSYFSEPLQANSSGRFYRIRSP